MTTSIAKMVSRFQQLNAPGYTTANITVREVSSLPPLTAADPLLIV